MSGMSSANGRVFLTEEEHIHQSVRDILTTPAGSRIMRREYGSLLPDLIDQPGTPANRMRLMSATVMAIIQWEPRLAIQQTSIDLNMAGQVTVDMAAIRRSGPRAGSPVNLSIPLR